MFVCKLPTRVVHIVESLKQWCSYVFYHFYTKWYSYGLATVQFQQKWYNQGEKIVLVQFKKPQVHRMSEFFNWTSTIFHLEEYNFFLHWTRAHMIIEFICYSFKVFESSNGAFKFFNNSVEHLKILNHPVEHLDIVSRAYRFQQSN